MKKTNIYVLIAVLCTVLFVSCAKSNSDTIKNEGEPTTLTITMGSGVNLTRASGAPVVTDEQKIEKGIILVYKPASGGGKILDGYATFDFTSATGPFTKTVNITRGVRDVYVVANVPDAIINELKVKSNASGLGSLTNRLSLNDFTKTSALPISGSATSVDCTSGTVASPATVTVQMYFVGSRIHIDWDISAIPAEVTAAGLAVEGVYLLNVKASSDLFKVGSMTSLASNEPNYLCGLANPSSFSTGAMYPTSTNTYSNTTPQLYMGDIVADKGFDKNYFYIFETTSDNTYSPDRPLVVVIQAKTTDGTKYYYPVVINSSENGSGTGNATNPGDGTYDITRGKIYNVKAFIKNFGNDNPYNEIKKGALTVTITPAAWIAVPQIDQEFN